MPININISLIIILLIIVVWRTDRLRTVYPCFYRSTSTHWLGHLHVPISRPQATFTETFTVYSQKKYESNVSRN